MRNRIRRYLKKYDKLSDGKKIFFDREIRRKIPIRGGVYGVFRKEDMRVLYIGKTNTNNLQRRIGNIWSGRHILRNKLLKEHKQSKKKVQDFLAEKCYARYIVIEDKNARNLFEHFAIAVLNPKYNG